MTQYANNQVLRYGFEGTGATFRIALYQGDNFVKNLITGLTTTAGDPVEFNVNTQTGDAPGQVDFIPPGEDYTVRAINEADSADNGIFPIGPFDVFESGDVAFAEINWNGDGFLFAANAGVYQDSAGTQTSGFFHVDPASGVVGNVALRKPDNVNVDHSLTQGSTSVKPYYGYDNDRNRPYLYSTGGSRYLNLSCATVNPGFLEFIYVLEPVGKTTALVDCYLLGDAIQLQFSSNSARVTLRRENADGNLHATHSVNLPVISDGNPHILRIKYSKNPSFGNSEIYLDDALISSGAVYMNQMGNFAQQVLRFFGSGSMLNELRLFTFQMKVHEFTPGDLAAAIASHKELAGIAA